MQRQEGRKLRSKDGCEKRQRETKEAGEMLVKL